MGTTLLDNRILLASFFAWAAAQISKTIYELIRQRKFVIGPLVSSGGMPSSHSALVTALATATGRVTCLGSAAFAITVVQAGNVMYDTASVRRDDRFQSHVYM